MAREPRDYKVDRVDSRREAKLDRIETRTPPTRGRPARGQPEAQRGQQPARADRFRRAGVVERFTSQIARRLAQVGPQNFRLPGRGRVVHDRRRGAAEQQTPEGQASGQGEAGGAEAGRARPNYFGDRQTLMPRSESTTAQPQAEKPLSTFEQKILTRFESGETQAQEAPEGKSPFLKKTAKQWKNFFHKFLHRTVKKQTDMRSLADAMTFRGLLGKKGHQGKGVMIGDLAFVDGHVEKFARFEVELQQIMKQFQGMEPGASINKQVISDALASELLQYFSIGPPKEDAAHTTQSRDTAGIFMALKTEAQIAERLGFAEDAGRRRVLREPARGVRRGGGTWSDEGDALPEEERARFVPWWSWDREQRGGLKRWFVPVTLGVIVVGLIIAAWLLMRGA